MPKSRFYERATLTAAVREKFVREIDRITWAYKLAPETLGMPASGKVLEIQVMEVAAKEGDVSNAVLDAIDKAVPSPIVFEVIRGDGTARRASIGAKAPLSNAGARFDTAWTEVAAPRAQLPAAIDLEQLFAGLLTPLLPLKARRGEALGDTLARVGETSRVEREFARLQARLTTEPQFNRKVEVRRELVALSTRLHDLRAER